MVQHFIMVDLMVDKHVTNNSTAMKFFLTTTSCGIQGKRAVIYIIYVHRRSSINRANFLKFFHYLCY